MDAKLKERSKDYTLLTIIFAFFVFFTASDLTFNALSKLEFASVCSILSGFLVFLGSFVVKKKNIEKGVNSRIDYVVSNFSWGNKVLGVLDIIFSLIALFTAIYWLGLIFRIGVVVRLACTLNKVKSVLKPVLGPLKTLFIAMYVYLGIRFKPIIMKMKESKFVKGIKKFFQWIWANKKSLLGTIAALATSAATGYATYGGYFSFLPPLMWLGINWTAILVALGIFILLELGVTGKGFERIATFLKRIAEEKAAKEEKAVVKEAEKAIKSEEKAKEKEAKAAEKEAKALVKGEEKAKAKAEAKAAFKAELEAKKAEKARLAEEEKKAHEALVEAKKAELLAKKAEENK